MKPKVYIETSVISYLTSRPSANLIDAARQRSTIEWFDSHSDRFELFVSELVVAEARRGDAEASARRLTAMEPMRVVIMNDSALDLTELLVESRIVPESVAADALHIAMATVNGADYLLTWNCKHIANATIRTRIVDLLDAQGWECPIICTPDVLLEN